MVYFGLHVCFVVIIRLYHREIERERIRVHARRPCAALQGRLARRVRLSRFSRFSRFSLAVVGPRIGPRDSFLISRGRACPRFCTRE
jgi:hypothetical protein